MVRVGDCVRYCRERWRGRLRFPAVGVSGRVSGVAYWAAYPEAGRVLRRHRRAWWRPWRCRCGRRFPCGARLTALDELLRVAAREACEWYPRYFADRRRPDIEGRWR